MPKNANPTTTKTSSKTASLAKTNPKSTNSVKKPTITEKLSQLDATVEWFYGDDFSLDQALDKYQSAVKLAKEVEQDLTEMKNKVEVLEDFTKS